jgi:hypothetical protein
VFETMLLQAVAAVLGYVGHVQLKMPGTY